MDKIKVEILSNRSEESDLPKLCMMEHVNEKSYRDLEKLQSSEKREGNEFKKRSSNEGKEI